MGKFSGLVFWRTSLIVWGAIFLFVAVQEVMGHVFLHPVEVLLVPGAIAIMSALQLSREAKSRNRN
jgi:hypothetical protein